MTISPVSASSVAATVHTARAAHLAQQAATRPATATPSPRPVDADGDHDGDVGGRLDIRA